ncbi:MAG: heavy-metal-associated domain-containing protein [Verrucomicrobiaceae bacterium]|nr:heavy-metal-associated domain-containing protein [Verrucomicrobiaceae bacterium]
MPKLLAAVVLMMSASLHAADPAVTRTFYVSGVECGSCVYMVQQSIGETKGVEDVQVVQIIDNYAQVTFNPKTVTDHQIAQAVREAIPLHGTPYLATLRVKMPEYAKHKAAIDQLFAGWKGSVTLVPSLEVKDEFAIHFEPLKADTKKAEPQGWRLAAFTEAMKGLGVNFTLVQEG